MEFSNLLVHIGYHKTGTTWLQRNLFGVAGRGFRPLGGPQEKRKHSLKGPGKKLIFAGDGEYLNSLLFDAGELRRQIEAETRTGEQGVPVVSNERLSGNPHAGGFDSGEMAQRLRAVFPEARIFIVIREQSGAILSAYHQYLKIGGSQSLEVYIAHRYDGRIPMFSLRHYEYHLLIRHYMELFGRDRVLVLPYEMFVGDGREFARRLASFSGAEVPLDELEYSTPANRSRNALVHSRTRLLNIFGKGGSVTGHVPLYVAGLTPFVARLRKLLSRTVTEKGNRAFLSARREWLANRLGDRYLRSNAETARLIGLDLEPYGYRMPGASAENPALTS